MPVLMPMLSTDVFEAAVDDQSKRLAMAASVFALFCEKCYSAPMEWYQAVGLALGAGVVGFFRERKIKRDLARAEEAKRERRASGAGWAGE
jgi:hypothetical protein